MSSPFAAAAQQEYPQDGWGVRWNEELKRWEAQAGPGAAAALDEPPAEAEEEEADHLDRVGSGDAAGSACSDPANPRPSRRRAVPSRRYSPSAAQQLQDETRGRPGGPSKYRGVIWHKSNSKWEARIYDNGKQRFLGYFTSEEEAARVYDEAAMRIGGRGARTNFPAGECLSRSSSAPAELLDMGGTSEGPTAAAPPAALPPKGGRLRKKASSSGTGGLKGSSKYRGVSWNSNCSKWRAQVWKGNDVRHLGYFEDEVAAARAYDRAVLEIRGAHAPTNFGPEDYGVAVPGPAAAATDTAEVDSPFLGVSWDAAAGSWKAELWDGREYALLGHFDSEEAAARAYDRACLAQHREAANTNYPPGDYEEEMAAAALISAVQRMSDDEEEASDLEMSALEALASISNEAEVDCEGDDAACTSGRGQGGLQRGDQYMEESPPPELRRRDSGPPFEREAPPSARLRRAMSDPIERIGSLSRRRSARLSDADAATAAAALAGLFTKPASSEEPAPVVSAAATNSRGARSVRSGGSADAPKSSAYKGVSWHKHSQKWYAYIQAAGKMRGLGYFDLQEDAARAYDAEARKVHGKKAVVNFRMYPDDVVREPKNRGVSSGSADTSGPSLEALPSASISIGEDKPSARPASGPRSRGGRSERLCGKRDRAGSPTSEEVSRGTPRVGGPRSSKFRGVSWHKHRRMWQVYIHVQSQARNSYHMGYFAEEIDAAKAYDREILKVRGKDAVTNFPDSEMSGDAELKSLEHVAAAAGDGHMLGEDDQAGSPTSAQPLTITYNPASADQGAPEDGEASPTCSAFSLGSLPLRKRSRKPKHVHSTAETRSPSPPRHPKPPRHDAAEAKRRQGTPLAEEGGMQLRNGEAGRGRRVGSPQKEPWAAPSTSGGVNAVGEAGGDVRASFRGVTRLERERKWVARVWNGQKQLTLGRFDTDVAAAQAYDREMLRMKGRAAVTNFPADMYGPLVQVGQQTGGEPLGSAGGGLHPQGNQQHPAAGEGVVGESDVPSPRRPVAKSSPAGSFALTTIRPASAATVGNGDAAPGGSQMALPGSKSTSQYRGVTWNSIISKWVAVAWDRDAKKARAIGFFDTEEQAAHAYDVEILAYNGPAATLNFPQSKQIAAMMNKAPDARPTSAGSAVSSTDVVLDLLASMTPQSTSQTPGQPPVRQAAGMDQLASFLRSGAPVPPEFAQALQMMSRGQQPASQPSRSPLQAPSPTSSPSHATAGAPRTADSTRAESVPPGNGALPANADAEETPSPVPSPLQRHVAANLAASVAASPRSGSAGDGAPSMERGQRVAAVNPKAQRGANTSRFRGVSLNKASGKFEARIREAGKNHYLGSFSDEEEAARAFDAAALAMRGRNAVCNFLLDDGPGAAAQGASPRHTRQVTVRTSPTAAPAAAAFPGPPRSDGPAPNQAPQMRAAPQGQGVREAELSRDDIVAGARESARLHAPHGEEAIKSDQLGSLAEAAVAQERAAGASPCAAAAGDTWPGLAPPAGGRVVGSTVAALRGRVQQMGGADARAHWPGPGRRSSQYKGVSWSEASAKWRAQCWDGSKVKYIGYFDGEEEAARAYDTAMLALRGNSAQTNFAAAEYTGEAIAKAEDAVWGQRQHRAKSEEPTGVEGIKVELAARVRVPSRRVTSPTNAAAHSGRAAPPSFAYHQGTSQYKGVSWSERSKKWRAQLWHENKVNHLGFWELEEDAARAYDAAVSQLRGAGAAVNFPAPGTVRPLVSSRTITTCPAGGPSTTVVVEAIPRINVNAKGSSKYRGVRWHERNGRWEARIFDNSTGKQISLGYYEAEEEAARAYDAESIRIRGIHAHVNLRAPSAARPRRTRRRAASKAVSSEEDDEASWPVKRPRGFNPAIARRDLQSMAAAAAAIASARPPEPGASKAPRTSCYRGVVWDPDTQYWAVRLATRGGERRQFGMFDTEIEAAIAYDAAVLELFGSRTPTNFDSEYGPAGSPLVPVPKRPRTESSAVARANAALFLLDTAVMSPSLMGPLAGNLQHQAQSAANLGAEIRRAVQARLGLPEPAADSALTRQLPGGFAPHPQGSSPDKQSFLRGAGAAAGSQRQDENSGVDVPVRYGVLADAAQQRIAVGTPPKTGWQPPAGSTQLGWPQGGSDPLQQPPALFAGAGPTHRYIAGKGQDIARELQLQSGAKGPNAGGGAADLHLPTPLKLPLLPAAAARDRPDSAGIATNH